MEDELLECHARVTEESEKWLELDRRFLTHTAEVDYDQEGKTLVENLFYFRQGYNNWLKLDQSKTKFLPGCFS